MELGIRLSYIEELKDSVQKRYNSLKAELKKNGGIVDGKKKEAITYAKEMMDHANKHYCEVKYIVEGSSKTGRVAKQITRMMISIRGYKEKINDLCKDE